MAAANEGKITRLSLSRIRRLGLLIGQLGMNFLSGSGAEVCFAICRRGVSDESGTAVVAGTGVAEGEADGERNYLEEVP